jgi:hypothetical protein
VRFVDAGGITVAEKLCFVLAMFAVIAADTIAGVDTVTIRINAKHLLAILDIVDKRRLMYYPDTEK